MTSWFVAYEANVVFRVLPREGLVFGRPANLVISFAAAALCLAGAARRRGTERIAWALVALAITAWSAGETYWSGVLIDQPSIPVPSAADVGYLAFPVLVFAAIALLVRPAVHVGSRLLLVDGVAAGLAIGALVSATVLGYIVDASPESVAINLTYALSDLVLLGLVVGAVAARGWHLDRMWALVGGAVLAFWIADTSYLITIANGSYRFPDPADAGWRACFLALAAAAWQPVTPVERPERLGRRTTVLPLAFAALALAVLAHGAWSGGARGGVLLAIASLVAVGVRMMTTVSAHVVMLDSSRQEALTDALTGLGNRRALLDDLGRAVARARSGTPGLLVLFDLDGFKSYNDAYGHPAGDALLTRLGGRLARQAEGAGGRAYRMGGDEFCVLLPLGGATAQELCAVGAVALSETGGGFSITASLGATVLEGDGADVDAALRTADRRMYEQKHGGRASADRQVSDVLVRALVERDGELGAHVRDVAAMAVAVARDLGLDQEQCGRIGHAAMLHDVGKVAIPDAILDKPGGLDEAEWAFMRRHTIMGERIVGAAPSLADVAALVRASHERWDGRGYPDGLAGEAIPLGSRIVATCDAYDAMRTTRPYSPARTEAEALQELRRCSGTQFDPAVVESFTRLRAAAGRPDPAPGATLPVPVTH